MSLELVAYGDDPSPVAIADLIARCRERCLECRVIRGGGAGESSHAVSDGALSSEDAVVAWRPSAPDARAAGQAAAAADWEIIGEFEGRGAVGVCVVEMSDKPEEYNNENDLREQAIGYAPGYTAARQQSRVCWYVRLQAGRNRLSSELAETVLRTLLELRGGMLDNPQERTYERVRRGDVSLNQRVQRSGSAGIGTFVRKLLGRDSSR